MAKLRTPPPPRPAGRPRTQWPANPNGGLGSTPIFVCGKCGAHSSNGTCPRAGSH